MREVRRIKMISRPGGVLGEISSVLNNYLFVKIIFYAQEGDLVILSISRQSNGVFTTNSDFLIHISLQPNAV